ncbi:hypothetical protein AMAG_20650 [Allomyces macrogynus ATCC 38327]|uniref:Uncharacterized protein n=1 Tax=Allomyces macrogynus (strain ATCC 38327) TaxID=578462 RepID=A0A0L0TE94_ALLM3|nr:hypothetical protein AMAG_20650 [Allomyces macrogynus ATCC 38327]|eukprot:KNE72976.1 hypothetical protein AMAG_20650 [Allomyces macrogynus ATCC 38327]
MLGHAPRHAHAAPGPSAPAPAPVPRPIARVPEPSAACGLRRRTSSTVHSISASAPAVTRISRASSLPRSPRSPAARSFPPVYDAPLDDDDDSDVDDECEPVGWSASRHYAQYASSYTSSSVVDYGSTPPWADRTASSSTRYLANYSLFGGGGGMRAPGPVPPRGPARVPVSVFGSPPPLQGGFVPRYAPPGAVQAPTGMPWSVR